MVKDVDLAADHASAGALAMLHTVFDAGEGADMAVLLPPNRGVRLAHWVITGNVDAGPGPSVADWEEIGHHAPRRPMDPAAR